MTKANKLRFLSGDNGKSGFDDFNDISPVFKQDLLKFIVFRCCTPDRWDL